MRDVTNHAPMRPRFSALVLLAMLIGAAFAMLWPNWGCRYYLVDDAVTSTRQRVRSEEYIRMNTLPLARYPGSYAVPHIMTVFTDGTEEVTRTMTSTSFLRRFSPLASANAAIAAPQHMIRTAPLDIAR